MATTPHERLRELRKALNLSQKDMAASLGINFSTLSEIERGKNGLGFDLFKKLTNQYQVNPLYLINGEEPMIMVPTGMEERLKDRGKLGESTGGKLGGFVEGKLHHDQLGDRFSIASSSKLPQKPTLPAQHIPGGKLPSTQNLEVLFLHLNQRLDHIEDLLKQLLHLDTAD